MSATLRRYEGIDKVRSEEITREVNESLLPALRKLPLRKLPGFSGCYVFDDGEGVRLDLDRSLEDSKDAMSRRASPRAPRTSTRETSTIQKPIRRTVQGGFHESAAAW